MVYIIHHHCHKLYKQRNEKDFEKIHEKLKRVFERYTRLDAVIEKEYESEGFK